MNNLSSFLSCFIRSFPALFLTLFLLGHQLIYPNFLNFQVHFYSYALCFVFLSVESLFLLFYRDQKYPKALELGLWLFSALFLSVLVALTESPVIFFLVILFVLNQIFILLFLKQSFQAVLYFLYLSLFLPLFELGLEDGYSLIPFFAFLCFYLSVFYFVFFLIAQKKEEDKPFHFVKESEVFDLTLTSGFSRKLKPFFKPLLRKFSVFKEELQRNQTLLKKNDLEKQMDWSSAWKIEKDLNSLELFVSDFIEYTELFFIKLTKNRLSVDTLLKEVLKDLETHPKKPESLDLESCFKEQGSFYTFGSEEVLKKSFKNIIINAFEAYAFDEENVKLDIHISSFSGWMVLHFIDEGQGIEPEERQKVFTAFESKKFGLNGLGLAYAKKVIELHGGRVDMKREESKTKVIVRLPLRKEKGTTPKKLKKMA